MKFWKTPAETMESYHQENHPELRPGEMWITNTQYVGAPEVGYKSKRLGEKAYDQHGNVVEGMRPVFVSIDEYEEARKESKPIRDMYGQ